jgi:hypothetical protein
MPKRPRQAHIPQQSKRRKVRRPTPGTSTTYPSDETGRNGTSVAGDEPAFADEPVFAEAAVVGATTVATARTGRRLSSLRAPQERMIAPGIRAVPGQLPTFERAYLMRELRQIAIVSSSLLALIIVLTIVLR